MIENINLSETEAEEMLQSIHIQLKTITVEEVRQFYEELKKEVKEDISPANWLASVKQSTIVCCKILKLSPIDVVRKYLGVQDES